MKAPCHIVFFGASVTEQDVHHATGEVSGFVTYFQRHLAEGRTVSRVSAGSSDMSDAAMIYVEEVIALKPDICVLDWVTPVLKSCDPRFVRQVYFRLMQHGILPVTVFFPRRDRVQADTPIAREMALICETYKLPLYDASVLLEGHGADALLRDVVHTTPEGASVYAHAMADLLSGLTPGLPFSFQDTAPFVVREVTASKPPPLICRKISVRSIAPTGAPAEFCLALQQRVGPYSPVLSIRVFSPAGRVELPLLSLWDQWCNRERQCIKKIMHWHNGPMNQIDLTISPEEPEYGAAPQAEAVALAQRQIRPRGKLFMISTIDMPSVVTYS